MPVPKCLPTLVGDCMDYPAKIYWATCRTLVERVRCASATAGDGEGRLGKDFFTGSGGGVETKRGRDGVGLDRSAWRPG